MTSAPVSQTSDPEAARTRSPGRGAAIGLGLLVTTLWATSWVLIRFGLQEVPALTFAGLRYIIAAACLVPFLFKSPNRQALRSMDRRQWLQLIVLGVIFYTVAQGAQYIGLVYLPLASASVILNLTSLVVAGAGLILLAEAPSRLQWLGLFLSIAGLMTYFYPPVFGREDWLGIVIVLIAMLGNSGGTLLGRQVNRARSLPPIVVTAVSMGIGAVLMLGVGIVFQGLPKISLASWAAILWMAVVNTAFAFTLWSYTQRTLLAMESSIINNTMTVQIAILGWIFSNESLKGMEIIGILLVTIGTALVQLRSLRRSNPRSGT